LISVYVAAPCYDAVGHRRNNVNRGLQHYARHQRFGLKTVSLLAALMLSSPAWGNINLEWRPEHQTVPLDHTIRIGLYAVSDNQQVQTLAAMDVIFAWDPQAMQLSGLDDTGGPDLLYSGFPDDPYGLNEVIPPQDGDGIYTAWARFGKPVGATPEGTLITTFLFTAEGEDPGAELTILKEAGNPPGRTIVFDGEVPGKNVTGTLGSATVAIGNFPCALIVRHRLKYKQKRDKIISRTKLVQDVGRDWLITVRCTGPTGSQTKSRRTTIPGRSRRIKFKPDGPGLYTCAIIRIQDPQDVDYCVGEFRPLEVIVP